MKSQADDLAVLRKKFDEVDAIVRDYENRLAKFKAEFLVNRDLGSFDAPVLLHEVLIGLTSLGKLGHTKSLIKDDLENAQKSMGETHQQQLLDCKSSIEHLAERIQLGKDRPAASGEFLEEVIQLFESLSNLVQTALAPFRSLRAAYQDELKSTTIPTISRVQQIKVRNRIARRIRKENPLITWSQLADRVKADPEARELTIPITPNTVRQPFKTAGTRGQAKPRQPQNAVKQKEARPNKRP